MHAVAFFGATNLPPPILHNPVVLHVGKPFPTVFMSRRSTVLEPLLTVLVVDEDEVVAPVAVVLEGVGVSVEVGTTVGKVVVVVVVTVVPTFAPASNCAYT